MAPYTALRSSSVREVDDELAWVPMELESNYPRIKFANSTGSQGKDGSKGSFLGRIMGYISASGRIVVAAMSSMMKRFFGDKEEVPAGAAGVSLVEEESANDTSSSRRIGRFERAYGGIAMDGPIRGRGEWPEAVAFQPIFEGNDQRARVQAQISAEWVSKRLQEALDRCEGRID